MGWDIPTGAHLLQSLQKSREVETFEPEELTDRGMRMSENPHHFTKCVVVGLHVKGPHGSSIGVRRLWRELPYALELQECKQFTEHGLPHLDLEGRSNGVDDHSGSSKTLSPVDLLRSQQLAPHFRFEPRVYAGEFF